MGMRANAMVQTAIWLPRDLRDRIRAEVGERKMATEIRRRLTEWEELRAAGYKVETVTTRAVTAPQRAA